MTSMFDRRYWVCAAAGTMALILSIGANAQIPTTKTQSDLPAGWEVIDATDFNVKVSLPCKSSELQAIRGGHAVLYCVKPSYKAQFFQLDTSRSSFDEIVNNSDKECASFGGDHSAFVLKGHRFATEYFVKGSIEFFSQITEVSNSKSILLGLMSKDLANPANAEIAKKIFASVEFINQ